MDEAHLRELHEAVTRLSRYAELARKSVLDAEEDLKTAVHLSSDATKAALAAILALQEALDLDGQKQASER